MVLNEICKYCNSNDICDRNNDLISECIRTQQIEDNDEFGIYYIDNITELI